ncbi:hypothetical protein BT69DRAFT_1246368 [Atractiella rhizophila]|nr:hypothetical protein BT69DRAFT_1246368 [Atractiella rhizophila]
MSDFGREGLGDKLERNVKPDSQKSTTQQAGDKMKGTYEDVASSVQPSGEKSTSQKAGDAISGDGGNKSMMDKAKDAMGLGDRK